MLLETALKIHKRLKKSNTSSILKKVDEDFLPYVCHYDPNTILTKNGELLQVIRITGFKSESVSSQLISLREAVRDAIKNHVKDNKFAFWFNTIRRKKNITPKGEFKDFFSKSINDFWIKENNLADEYVNELYITIIVEGLDSSIVNFNSFLRSFSYTTTKNLHANFLSESHKKLTTTVEEILKNTTEYGAKLLGLKEWDGVIYSEPMRFFGKIINLYEERYPLSTVDISTDLSTHKVAFGNRELEVTGYNNKNFATMMSLKEYYEVSVDSLDRILQLPLEFIITQSFDFTFNKKDCDPYEYQNYILKVSGDEEFRQACGIANFIENRNNSLTDYGKLQTTIMLISKNRESLEKDTKSAIEQFNSLGFVVIREDVFAEHCFWAQLPGNFSHLRRQKLTNVNLVGGFASLYNFPSGVIFGGHWKNAVTVFKTVLNTPYFFNFHDHDDGHSLFLGTNNSNQTTIINFLVTQAQKFDTKLFYIDSNTSTKPLIKALNGNYYNYSSSKEEELLKLNPLTLLSDKNNKDFLISFFTSLSLFTETEIRQEELAEIATIVDKILSSPASDLATVIELFNTPTTPTLYKSIQTWLDEELKIIFNSQSEINFGNKINGFDLKEVIEQPALFVPILNYLLHKIEQNLDGNPAIIVLNDAWHLIDNPVIAPKIKNFLVQAKAKNAVVILNCHDQEKIFASKLIDEIYSEFTNKFFTNNHEPHQSYKEVLHLNDEDIEIIKMMDEKSGHVLIKRPGESIIISAIFPYEIRKTLNADEITIAALDELISSDGEEKNSTPQDWIPQFYELLIEIEKEEIAEQKRISRDAAAEARRRRLEADKL